MSIQPFSLKVHISALENVSYKQNNAKQKWEVGDALTVQIESHATVNMLKQRVSLIVLAHPKNQFFHSIDTPLPTTSTSSGVLESQLFVADDTKLEAVPGVMEKRAISLAVFEEPEKEEVMPELSDDEQVSTGDLLMGGQSDFFPEEATAAALSLRIDKNDADFEEKEMSDADLDKQGLLREQAQDALEDGDVDKAIKLLSEALLLGNRNSITAMAMAKRADLLLKKKQYTAYRLASEDCDLALTLNPDSGKAHRIKARALRFLGRYAESSKHFNEAQKIDYDDEIAEMHSYVTKRAAKIEKIKKMTAEKKKKEEEMSIEGDSVQK